MKTERMRKPVDRPGDRSLNILVSSKALPSGANGWDAAEWLLAEEFCELGHHVRVVTETSLGPPTPGLYQVLPQPSAVILLEAVRWCDIYLLDGINLRTAWPLLFVRRPWMVMYHSGPPHLHRTRYWRERFKMSLLRPTTAVASSQTTALPLPGPTEVIPDPYDDEIFRLLPGLKRQQDLIAVGRLVREQGFETLIRVLAQLAQAQLRPRLTVVGHGPDLLRLKGITRKLDLSEQVLFVGPKSPQQLATLLNQHRILVLPSGDHESSGVVALQGIACGCVVIASDTGNLKETIGPCGITFQAGNPEALAQHLRRLLEHREQLLPCQAQAAQHLQPHRRSAAAQAYLEAIRRALRRQADASRLLRSIKPAFPRECV